MLKLFFRVIKNLLVLKKMEPIPMRRLHIASTAIRIAVDTIPPQDACQYISYIVDFVSKRQLPKKTMSLQTTFWLKKPATIKTVSQALILLRNMQNMYVIDVLFSLVLTMRVISRLSGLGWDNEQLKKCLVAHFDQCSLTN